MKDYKFEYLYEISSGLSSTKSQAGHGAPFLSFSSVFNNFFLPDDLPDKMDTSIEEQERYSIKEGDIFLTRTSETLDELAMSSVAVKDYPYATYSGFLKRLRPKQTDITYAKFMAFYLRSAYFRKIIDNNATMTLRASFNEDIFSWLHLMLPDYNEQKKIGDWLYALESKIKNNHRVITTLESMAKTLYDYWFVQFDFPDANGRPYKTSGGKMEWNETLSREIPAGWEVKTLFDFVELKTDSHNPQESPDSVYEHYSIPAFDKEQFPVMEKGAQINSSKYCVAKDDILYSKLNPSFKRIWSPFVFTDKAVCSTEFLVFRVKNMKGYSYIYSVMNDDAFQSYMIQQSSSSTGSRKRVQPSNCMNYSFAVANDELCDKYSRVYHPIFEKRKRMIIENEKLASLRDFLLPMLMNGQVTFRQ